MPTATEPISAPAPANGNRPHGDLDGKVPSGPLETKWDRYKQEVKLISPANKRKFTVLIVGSGSAG